MKNFLRPNVSYCILILGNFERSGVNFVKQDQFYGKYFASFDEETNQINGILAHYWNGNLMMFVLNDQILKDLTRELLNDKELLPILGILDPEKQSQITLDELKISKVNSDSLEDLLELDLNEIKDCFFENHENFQIINPNQMNQDILFDWMKAYEIEALERNNDENLLKIVQEKIQRFLKGDCYVLVHKNKPVSLAAFNARFEKNGSNWPSLDAKRREIERFCKIFIEVFNL